QFKKEAVGNTTMTMEEFRKFWQKTVESDKIDAALHLNISIDERSKDYQNSLAQLKNVVNNVHLFTQSDQYIQLLNQIDNERVFIIISGYLGQHLTPEIHGMSQLDTIFIYCGNKSRHEEWIKDWTKIKGVLYKYQRDLSRIAIVC
ncbi:unnamed protein product, partial [Adineta ricciae]